MWEYRARDLSVVDGDTLRLLVDTGFYARHQVDLRLLDVWAPELKEPGGEETKGFVINWLDMIDPALNLTAKGGTLVVTGLAPMMETDTQLNLFMLSMLNKEVKGTIFGSLTPRSDIPRLLDMYRGGSLKLDELITNRYPLDAINDGYQAMRDGTNIRGVIVYD